jgi:hypothetical protein
LEQPKAVAVMVTGTPTVDGVVGEAATLTDGQPDVSVK